MTYTKPLGWVDPRWVTRAVSCECAASSGVSGRSQPVDSDNECLHGLMELGVNSM